MSATQALPPTNGVFLLNRQLVVIKEIVAWLSYLNAEASIYFL
jgi:hypothetical protein